MIRDLNGMKNVVIGLMSLWIVEMLVQAWSLWTNYLFFKRIAANDFGPTEDIVAIANGLDTTSMVLMWANIGTFVLIVIAFCIWTYQAARNAKSLSTLPQKISPGWAVGWYFVPLANLWMPFKSVREIWWRSAWPQVERAPPILNIWWILWVACNILDRAAGKLLNSDDLALLTTAAAVNAVMAIVWVAPASLLIWIVIRITTMQAAKHAANPNGPVDAFASDIGAGSSAV